MIAQKARVEIVQEMLAAAESEAAGIVAARERGACSSSDAERRLDLLRAQVQWALAFTGAAQPSASRPAPPAPQYRFRIRRPIVPIRVAGPAIAVVVLSGAAALWWAAPRPTSPPATTETVSRAEGPVGTSSGPTASAKADPVAALAEEWLKGYLRKDDARVAELSVQTVRVLDERASGERIPPGAGHHAWTFVETAVQQHGSVAVVTAKIIETGVDPVTGRPLKVETFTSQMLTNRGGTWLVSEARLVSAAALGRAFR